MRPLRSSNSAAALLLTILLESCGLEATVQQPSEAQKAAAPPTEPTGPLTKFIGAYPFDDVGGETFLTNSVVMRAVTAAVTDPDVRIDVLGGGVAGPIRARSGALVSWSCTPHMCNARNWTITIDGEGRAAVVCYYDVEIGPQTRWYRAGAPVERRENVGDAGCLRD